MPFPSPPAIKRCPGLLWPSVGGFPLEKAPDRLNSVEIGGIAGSIELLDAVFRPKRLGVVVDMAGGAVLHKDSAWPISLALADERKEQRLGDLPDIPSEVDAAVVTLEKPRFPDKLPLWLLPWLVSEACSTHTRLELPLAPQFWLALCIEPV